MNLVIAWRIMLMTLLGRETPGLVAKIGGNLGRNSDPPPGHQLIWHGYAALQLMSFGYELKEE